MELKNQKQYMNREEVCEFIGLSRYTITELIKRRQIPFIALSKRTYRFDIDKIKGWMMDHEIPTTDEVMKKAT